MTVYDILWHHDSGVTSGKRMLNEIRFRWKSVSSAMNSVLKNIGISSVDFHVLTLASSLYNSFPSSSCSQRSSGTFIMMGSWGVKIFSIIKSEYLNRIQTAQPGAAGDPQSETAHFWSPVSSVKTDNGWFLYCVSLTVFPLSLSRQSKSQPAAYNLG